MAITPPSEARITTQRYFALVDEGVLQQDDRVELLEGVVVAVAPQGPRHGTCLHKVADALRAALPPGYSIRTQAALIAGPISVPEPDVAIVRGTHDDYAHAHPDAALLVVEVAASSLAQDRITKQRIYAAAGLPHYWIVNLREDFVEVYSDAEPEQRCYAECRVVARGEFLEIPIPGAHAVAVTDLLPPPLPADA